MSLIRTARFILSHPLNRGHALAALRRFVNWQIGSRFVPGAVACNWVNGSRFLVARGETGLTGNVYTGLHEFADMAFVLHCLRPEDLFVDVGANVGSYTILACAAVGAAGMAFEPLPKTFGRLIDNVRLNGMEARVRCLNMGVAAGRGTVAFTSGLDTMNHVVATDESSKATMEIETTSLDEALAGVAPFLIKIDVEGYETHVIEGAARTLGDPRLHAVIMELNGSGRRYGFDETALVRVLRDHGFESYTYDPFSRSLTWVEPAEFAEGNMIFVRNVPVVESRLRSAKTFRVNGIDV